MMALSTVMSSRKSRISLRICSCWRAISERSTSSLIALVSSQQTGALSPALVEGPTGILVPFGDILRTGVADGLAILADGLHDTLERFAFADSIREFPGAMPLPNAFPAAAA